MPRNVRNFWVELDIDGKTTEIATGPRNKDGGFSMLIKIRENGSISSKRMKINGFANNGDLEIVAAKFEERKERDTEYLTIKSKR